MMKKGGCKKVLMEEEGCKKAGKEEEDYRMAFSWVAVPPQARAS